MGLKTQEPIKSGLELAISKAQCRFHLTSNAWLFPLINFLFLHIN
jgi:hypothetical protein